MLLVDHNALATCENARGLSRETLTSNWFDSVPLGFVFPPLLHYKACAHTTRQKVADIALLVFGVIAAIFSTSQTVRACSRNQTCLGEGGGMRADRCRCYGSQIQLFASGDQAAPPTFGSCPPHA